MIVTHLDPADSVAMVRWHDLMAAISHHDLPDFPTPSRREHMARFAHPWPATTEEALLVWDGDRVIGAASYVLPQTANLNMVNLELIVHPQHRRRAAHPAHARRADR